MDRPPDDLPPAAKLVYKLLEYEGPATRADLEQHTQLVASTINDSLQRLEDEGIVEREYHLSDPKTPVYSLPPESREEVDV